MNFNETEKVVFKNEKGKYTIGISNKKQDGSFENAYIPIQFNKGVEIENQTKIKIKNAWLSFYKWENEYGKGTTFFVKCSDFEEVSNPARVVDPLENINNGHIKTESFGSDINITDEDLPF